MVNAQKKIYPGHTHAEREEHSRAEQTHGEEIMHSTQRKKVKCQVTLKSLSGIPVHTSQTLSGDTLGKNFLLLLLLYTV